MTGPQYPQQQPYGQPYPAQPPKKSKKWLFFLLIPIAVCGIGGGCTAIIASSADKADTSTTAGAAAPKPNSRNSVAAAGSEVRDGKFSFVVTAVDAPVPTVGTNPYMQQTAQGEYIQVHVQVTNIGDEPRGYFGGNQTLIDAQGREFTNDSRAEINVNDHLSQDINPGNAIAAILVFDVPVGAIPGALELHDSAFSGGAKVALR